MSGGRAKDKTVGNRHSEIWKGEEWGGEHDVDKMDILGTFRTLHNRELLGRKTGNLKEVGLGWINGGSKDQDFGWGKI